MMEVYVVATGGAMLIPLLDILYTTVFVLMDILELTAKFLSIYTFFIYFNFTPTT